MNPTIQPYQFNIIKEQVAVLLNTYRLLTMLRLSKLSRPYVPKKSMGYFQKNTLLLRFCWTK